MALKCLNCDFVVEGNVLPIICPSCGNEDLSKYIRVESDITTFYEHRMYERDKAILGESKSMINEEKINLTCNGVNCGSNTFHLVRIYDKNANRFTHQTVCSICGEIVVDPNEILSTYHVELSFNIDIKGRNGDDAIKNARLYLSQYPDHTYVVSCKEV
jgi:hypothetical protein